MQTCHCMDAEYADERMAKRLQNRAKLNSHGHHTVIKMWGVAVHIFFLT